MTHDAALYVPEDTTLAMLVEKAKTAFSDNAEASARIHRGAYLVEHGAVDYGEHGIEVTSKGNVYFAGKMPIGKMCKCADAVIRKAPCKHMFAKWLAIRVVQYSLGE